MQRFLVSKRQRQGDEGGPSAEACSPPPVIVSWNCNSLRLRAERKELGAAVAAFLAAGATALVLQEVRLKPEERAACESALRSAGLNQHRFYWSLHPGNKRYSGTALVVHTAHTPLSVRFDLAGLADPGVKYSGAGQPGFENPEKEGRLVIAEYEAAWLVCVYVPMCGWYAPARARRDAWDRRFSSALRVLRDGKEAAAQAQASAPADPVAAAPAEQQPGQPLSQAGKGQAPNTGKPHQQDEASQEQLQQMQQQAQQPEQAGGSGEGKGPPQVPQGAQSTPGTKAGAGPAAGSATPKITSFFMKKSPSTAAAAGGGAPTQVPPLSQPQPQAQAQGTREEAGQPASSQGETSQAAAAAAAGEAGAGAATRKRTAEAAVGNVGPAPQQARAATSGRSQGMAGRPLLVVGDLNVCHTPLDVSHPEFFAAAYKPVNVGGEPSSLQGQPGYCEDERERFGGLFLAGCDLVDTWRELHPNDKRLTWGFASNFEVGRYAGKYMGLDYALVSRSLWDAGVVQGSEILGSGQAGCYGSDHLPICVRLDWSKAPSTAQAGQE